jgi:hypothetical protein
VSNREAERKEMYGRGHAKKQRQGVVLILLRTLVPDTPRLHHNCRHASGGPQQ